MFKSKILVKSKLAFTLAEVLITLGIIGIVAALTIPTLMNRTQNAEFITQMKKDYSVLSSAYTSIKADNGGEFVNALSSCTDNDHLCLKNIFKTKLQVNRECQSPNSGDCFPSMSEIKRLDGSSANDYYLNLETGTETVLNDGSALIFYLDSATCKSTISPSHNNRCGWITVDVNGLKKPNTWGKDLYTFIIFSDLIKPAIPDITDIVSGDDCETGTNFGYTCSAKYLYGK